MSDKENCDLDDTPTGEMSDRDRLKLRKKYKDILNEFSREEANPGTQQEEGTIKDAMDRVSHTSSPRYLRLILLSYLKDRSLISCSHVVVTKSLSIFHGLPKLSLTLSSQLFQIYYLLVALISLWS